MIPGIFAITNNKCYEAYKLIFTDLLSKITIKADNTKLKFSIFTSDFKKALNTSIKVEFINLCPNIRHIIIFLKKKPKFISIFRYYNRWVDKSWKLKSKKQENHLQKMIILIFFKMKLMVLY